MHSLLKGWLVLSLYEPICDKDYINLMFFCHIRCRHKLSASGIFKNLLTQVISFKKVTIGKLVCFFFSLVYLGFGFVQCTFKDVFILMH